MVNHEAEQGAEVPQGVLKSIKLYAEKLRAQHPSEVDNFDSAYIPADLPGEENDGLLGLVVISSRYPDTIFTISYSQYGKGYGSESADLMERLVLHETQNGTFFLEKSERIQSAADAVYRDADGTLEESASAAILIDEPRLSDMHQATIEEAADLADRLEVALLGNEYRNAVRTIDDIDWVIADWRDEIEGVVYDASPVSKAPRLIALKALRKLFRKNKP